MWSLVIEPLITTLRERKDSFKKELGQQQYFVSKDGNKAMHLFVLKDLHKCVVEIGIVISTQLYTSAPSQQ